MTWDWVNDQAVKRTEQNTWYTFDGFLPNGLTYNYYRDGSWADFSTHYDCPSIVKADWDKISTPGEEGRCAKGEHHIDLKYDRAQAYMMQCIPMWQSYANQSCMLGAQTRKIGTQDGN